MRPGIFQLINGRLLIVALAIAIIVAAIAVAVLDNSHHNYADLSYYERANRHLASFSDAHRIVFFGDSITARWDMAVFFPGKPYVNRGIVGETTSQMVLRFHQDVVDLSPEAVVILAGINDLAFGIPIKQIEANYAAMVEMARANHIAVYFGSVLPSGKISRHPPEKIIALNSWLKEYCTASGAVYVNYADQMNDIARLTGDGIHPNNKGYALMSSILSAELEKSTQKEQ
jgi:lysophospholipase L1-like esterase